MVVDENGKRPGDRRRSEKSPIPMRQFIICYGAYVYIYNIKSYSLFYT